jgi:hypothetical protein
VLSILDKNKKKLPFGMETVHAWVDSTFCVQQHIYIVNLWLWYYVFVKGFFFDFFLWLCKVCLILGNVGLIRDYLAWID